MQISLHLAVRPADALSHDVVRAIGASPPSALARCASWGALDRCRSGRKAGTCAVQSCSRLLRVTNRTNSAANAAAIVATAIVLQPSRPSAVAAAGDAAAASAGADGAPAGAAVGAAACSCCFATLLRRLSSRSTATDLFQATSLRLSSPQGAQRSVPKQQPWHRIYFIATRRCCQRGTHTNGTAYPRGTLYVRTQVSHTHT